ncbi:putative membrane protein YhhN [Microbacteriaceae bacterium SG_E_30_P1]|uniref:Membrane protein YhhN n=1 Tax=Antiquaquibacter oligotrophicus TaxID=2880260 RepID=A0ABT6KLS2_9MICO|nr:lysoplasmalogenase [Antiquaquibacter oligotrophicus]MDH6180655.1 putative membrane protein YhhN [Antiquaquibacter oligotrophicus]UDF13617.1 lysoplasmalogenase [Antiquaquibacter oligotrophicus]
MASSIPRSRTLAFGPFVIVAIVHLVTLGLLLLPVAYWAKVSVMPALLLALLVAVPRRRSEIALWAALALVFASVGDALLRDPGEAGFLIGLGAFVLTHVAYLVLFLRPLRRRRPPLGALGYAVWLIALLVLLVPHTGALTVAVVFYGALVCAVATAALGTTPIIAVGAFLFLVSDSLLALRLFVPGFEFWQQDVIIMTFYIGGQGLIVLGAVREAWRRERALPN